MEFNEEEKHYQNQIPGLGSFLNADTEDSVDESFSDPQQPAEDNHIIGKAIAEGGLKIVYVARDRRTGREVAMAQIKPDLESQENIERFLREARILANLEHSNIVPIHEISQTKEGRLFFTMKLLEGETLADVLRKLGEGDPAYAQRFPLHRLINIFMRICDAMKYAHTRGVVHLDLKPENIILNDFGEVSVIDWGIARDLNSEEESNCLQIDSPLYTPLTKPLEEPRHISGTPGYMAPEQISGSYEDVSVRTDIYALGAVLYAILFQKRPNYGYDLEETLERTKSGEIAASDKKTKRKTVSRSLMAIAQKAMQAKPRQRYANVDELQNDLSLFFNNFPTSAETFNLVNSTKLFLIRNHKSISVTLAMLLIAAVGLGLYRELKEQKRLNLIEKTKIEATADEIITGTKQKHELLRKAHKYDEIIENFQKLKSVGYSYPEFWFDEAKVHAGNLDFEKAIECMYLVSEYDTDLTTDTYYVRMLHHLEKIIKIRSDRELSHKDLVIYSLNMPYEARHQLLWKLNNDPSKTLKERVTLLRESLALYNKSIPAEEMHFEYSIDGDRVRLDISNNYGMTHAEPLLGLNLDELDISHTQINLAVLKVDLKKCLRVLKISGNKYNIESHFIDDSQLEKIIAKDSFFSAHLIGDAEHLTHLDIEEARLGIGRLFNSDHLEYLNIAYTDFKNMDFLENMPNLKELVIDASMPLDAKTKTFLTNQSVDITVKPAKTNEN